MNIETIYCPKCGNTNTITMKAKQPDGTIEDSIIKVQMLGMDMKTGENVPVEGVSLPYKSCTCGDCNCMFAVGPQPQMKAVFDGEEGT